MSWRAKLQRLSPEERRRAIEEIDREENERIRAMTDEQLTLWLARSGVSPEDLRRGLDRCMKMIDDAKEKAAD